MSLQPHRPLLRVAESEDVTVVTVATESLGEANIQEVGQDLFAVADRLVHRGLELDLGEVPSMTSTALGKFISLHKRVRERGGRLVIVNLTDPVREVFEVTQLHRVLD